MATMWAARFHNHHDIRVENILPPTVGPLQVLVAVEWCGICGSDLHEYITGPRAIPSADRPHIMTRDTLPITMGHEFCGRVHSAPAGSKFKKGQAVAVDPRLCCRKCLQCKASRAHGCETIGFLGISGGGGGGLSEFVAVDESMLHAIPNDIPIEFAALAEPLAVAYHAIKVSGVKNFEKSDVLIIGGGPIGYAMVLTLRACGAKSIFLSQTSLKRREQVTPLVEAVFNPKAENVGERCRVLTGGKGVEVVFDCAGVQTGLDAAIDALAHSGMFVHLSVWDEPMVLPWFPVLMKEINIKGCCVYTDQEFAEVVQMISEGKFKGYEKMVTSRILLEDVVSKGFEELIHHKDDHLKILITPNKKNLP